MTTNYIYLKDALSRRIARGSVTARDLDLLLQILRCQRRKCLIAGAMCGASMAFMVTAVAAVTF